MEIGPVPGVRALPAVRTREADLRPPAIFDIEGSARAGDGAGQGNRRKAAGAEEDDEDEFSVEEEAERGAETLENPQFRRISYFA